VSVLKIVEQGVRNLEFLKKTKGVLRMKNYSVNDYNRGSLAYKEYVEEENKFDVRVAKVKGVSKKNPTSPLKIGLLIVSIVAIVVSLLAQYATIAFNQNRINSVKAEIKGIEDEIYNVDVQIAETLDLANVKKIAIGKLGMVMPSDNQLMYVEVPKKDYTVNY